MSFMQTPSKSPSPTQTAIPRKTPVKPPTPPVSKESPSSARAIPDSPPSANTPDRVPNEAEDGDLREEFELLQEQLAEAEKQVASLELKEFSYSEQIAKLKEELSTVRAAILHVFDAVIPIYGHRIDFKYSIRCVCVRVCIYVCRSKRRELSWSTRSNR